MKITEDERRIAGLLGMQVEDYLATEYARLAREVETEEAEKLDLTPEERQAANDMGLQETTYAAYKRAVLSGGDAQSQMEATLRSWGGVWAEVFAECDAEEPTNHHLEAMPGGREYIERLRALDA